MSNTTPINSNMISIFVSDLVSGITPASIAADPIVQAGVDIVGKPLGWQQPPSVISSPSVRMLLQGSPAAVTGGAIALKTLLTTEIATAMAAAPAASAGLIGLALIVGVAIGTGIDYALGALLKDGKIDTLSEWLATKWSESSSLPISQALPNERGQWTTGWRYIPQNAPSGTPADPIRSPGERGSPVTAPAVPSTEEMEMKRKKEETIVDRPERHETLEASSPKQLDLDPVFQKMVEDIRKNPDDHATWAVFADYLSEHGEAQRGELILLDIMISQTGDPATKDVLEEQKKELEKALEWDLRVKLEVIHQYVVLHWKRGYLEKVIIRADSFNNHLASIEDNPKFFDALFQSEDSRFLRTLRFTNISDGSLQKFLSYPQIARISDFGFILDGYTACYLEGVQQISHEGVRALTESPYLKSLTNFQMPVYYGRGDDETRRMLSDWARKNSIPLDGKIY